MPKSFRLRPRRAGARRRKSLWIAAALIAVGAAAFLFPQGERGAGAVPAVRLHGKLGPPVGMGLSVAEDTGTGEAGDRSVTLRLTLTPGTDLAGSRIDFLLPPRWTVISGCRSGEADLAWGEERVVEIRVLVPDGAARGAGARVRAGGFARETYVRVAGRGGESRLTGRIDRDPGGRRVRVFRAGERRR